MNRYRSAVGLCRRLSAYFVARRFMPSPVGLFRRPMAYAVARRLISSPVGLCRRLSAYFVARRQLVGCHRVTASLCHVLSCLFTVFSSII